MSKLWEYASRFDLALSFSKSWFPWLVPFVTGPVAFYLARLGLLPLWQLWLIGLFGVIAGLAISILLHEALRRFHRLQAVNLEAEVQEWAMYLGYSVSRPSDPDMEFLFTLQIPPTATKIMVGRKKKDRFLTVASAMSADASVRQLLDEMSNKRRESFVFQLRAEMNRLGLNYSGFEPPMNEMVITRVLLVRDGLTIQDFIGAVGDVLHANLLIGHLFGIERHAVVSDSSTQTPVDGKHGHA